MIAERAPGRSLPKSHRALGAVAKAVLPSSVLVTRGGNTRRRIALTFDDGPCELTPAYLDLLEKHAARATFFVVGSACEQRPELLREIELRGHGIGGHGHSHQRFPELSADGRLREELRATAALLPAGHGGRLWVRPPYGALSLATLVTCVRAGFTIVLWSLDSEDWRTTETRDVCARVSADTTEPGSIVLMHEGQAWTLEALAEIVPNLQRSGYELVTVDELLAA